MSQHRRLAIAAGVVALVTTTSALLGIGVRATDGGHAAVDEPQYLLSALSLAEDGDLDISDELAEERHAVFHPAPLPVQTAVQPDGSQISPHDPLLPLLLAVPMGFGGWVAAKATLALLAGLLAALILWLAVVRLGVRLRPAAAVVGTFGATAPLAVYGQQVYPELPAALAVAGAVAVLGGRLGRVGSAGLVAYLVALPWLSGKYVPVAAVLAAIGLIRLLRRGERGRAAQVVAALIGNAVAYLLVHRAVYGGWTAYASGDHFQSSGEFGVIGFTPDLLGRSSRLAGLLVDRDFGLLAWQPAWLLLVPALAALLARRPANWPDLVIPLTAAWLTATFVALTMHGFWWPGRQFVAVLPLAVLAITWWVDQLVASRRVTVLAASAALGLSGVAVQVWLLVAGWSGRIDWVGATDVNPPAVVGAMRAVLPDYRDLSTQTWALHAAWTALVVVLALAAWRGARRATSHASTPAPTTDHSPAIAGGH